MTEDCVDCDLARGTMRPMVSCHEVVNVSWANIDVDDSPAALVAVAELHVRVLS